MIEAGARLRYEPVALVAHDHRTQLREWFARKAFYGESAAPLTVRHPGKTAPLVISGWTLWSGYCWRWARASATWHRCSIAAFTGRRIAKLATVETEPKEVAVVAARGLWSAALQLASAICRHYWPIAFIAALLSRRCRQVVLVAAIIDGVVDWITRNGNADDETKRVGLVSYCCSSDSTISPTAPACGPGVVRERNAGRAQAADPDLKWRLDHPAMC